MDVQGIPSDNLNEPTPVSTSRASIFNWRVEALESNWGQTLLMDLTIGMGGLNDLHS